jgi:hypothetical protein
VLNALDELDRTRDLGHLKFTAWMMAAVWVLAALAFFFDQRREERETPPGAIAIWSASCEERKRPSAG